MYIRKKKAGGGEVITSVCSGKYRMKCVLADSTFVPSNGSREQLGRGQGTLYRRQGLGRRRNTGGYLRHWKAIWVAFRPNGLMEISESRIRRLGISCRRRVRWLLLLFPCSSMLCPSTITISQYYNMNVHAST